jgi:hypothetical protein
MSDLDRRSRDEDGDVRLAANFAGSLRDVLEWMRDLTVIVPSDWPPNPLKAAAGLAAGVLRDCPQVSDNRPTVPSDNRIRELDDLLSSHWRVPLHRPSSGEDVVLDARAALLASVLLREVWRGNLSYAVSRSAAPVHTMLRHAIDGERPGLLGLRRRRVDDHAQMQVTAALAKLLPPDGRKPASGSDSAVIVEMELRARRLGAQQPGPRDQGPPPAQPHSPKPDV